MTAIMCFEFLLPWNFLIGTGRQMRENDFFCRFIKHLWGDSKSFLLGVLKKIHFLLNRKKRRRKSIDIYLWWSIHRQWNMIAQVASWIFFCAFSVQMRGTRVYKEMVPLQSKEDPCLILSLTSAAEEIPFCLLSLLNICGVSENVF